MKRILAWAGVFVIAALLVLLIVLAVSGAEAGVIVAALVCLVLFPAILYGCMLFYRMTGKRRENEKEDGE